MNRTPRAAILLHMLLVWGWAWFWLGEPLSLALWLGPGLCVLSLTLAVKGAWGAFTRTNELRDGRVSQKIEPLETSRKQDSLSSFFWYLCWVESPFIAPHIPQASVPMRHDPLDPACCVAESQQRWLSLLRSGQVLATGILEQGSVSTQAGYSGPLRTS